MNINWQQFGLKTNPYDTLPLVEGGDLPLRHAFIGRDSERKYIDDFFESENNVCLTLCGDTGVGKTSLANFQKFIWKHAKDNPLFSCRREIEASEILKKPPSNISGYYFKPLKDLGILEEKEKQGRAVYFGLTVEYQPLKWWVESEAGVRRDMGAKKIKQMSLFGD